VVFQASSYGAEASSPSFEVRALRVADSLPPTTLGGLIPARAKSGAWPRYGANAVFSACQKTNIWGEACHADHDEPAAR
jgi:hypothetical protein